MKDVDDMTWNVINIEGLCEFVRNGKSIQQDKNPSGLPITRIETIWNGEVDDARVGYAGLSEKDAGNYLLEHGDILFSHINSLEHIGKCAIYSGHPEKLIHGMNLLGLRPKKSIVDPKFLLYLLRTKQTRVKILALTNKSVNQASISASSLKSIDVSIPPLAEQKRIAAILDQADALRGKRRAALARLDALVQSLFLEMFAGASGANYCQVSVESVSKQIRTGPFGSQLLHSEFTDDRSGVMVLGIDNAVQNRFVYSDTRYITPEKYQQLRRYTVHPDDVIITIMGTCGRCAIVPQNVPLAINTKHLCCITLDQEKCLPTYLKHCFLMHPSVLKQLGVLERGAVMPGLNMGIIKNLSIPLPPLDVQTNFSQFIQKIELTKAAHERSFIRSDSLFFSLQQRAFRGDL